MESSSGTYKWALATQSINLRKFGRQYFDFYTLDDEGHFSSQMDLFNLDQTPLDSTISIGTFLDNINQNYEFSLPNFHENYFDSTTAFILGGSVFEKRTKTLKTNTYKIDYGLSNDFTFHLSIPIIQTQTVSFAFSDFEAREITGMDNFISYHESAKSSLDDFKNSIDFYTLSASERLKILDIYNRFYTEDGEQSILWALNGGKNPLENGIFLSEFNPTTQSDSVTIMDLLDYYYPDVTSAVGIGDMSMGVSFLIYGEAPWQKEGRAIYASASMLIPMGKRMEIYSTNKDAENRHKQFYQMTVGSGVTKYQLGLGLDYFLEGNTKMRCFGKLGLQISLSEKLPTPIRLFGMGHTHPDSNLISLGTEYKYKSGNAVLFSTGLETFHDAKKRMSTQIKYSHYYKGKDQFSSIDSYWNQWMQAHEDYDTKQMIGQVEMSLMFHNHRPRRQIGPIPFNVSLFFNFPLFVKHTWKGYSTGINFTTYIQYW